MLKIYFILVFTFYCSAIEDRAKKDAGFIEIKPETAAALLLISRQNSSQAPALPNCQTGTNASFSSSISTSNSRTIGYNEDINFTAPASSSGSVTAYCGFRFDPTNKSNISLILKSSSRASFSVFVSSRLITFSTDATYFGFSSVGSSESSLTITNIIPPASTTNPWFIYLVQNNSTNCSGSCNYSIRLNEN